MKSIRSLIVTQRTASGLFISVRNLTVFSRPLVKFQTHHSMEHSKGTQTHVELSQIKNPLIRYIKYRTFSNSESSSDIKNDNQIRLTKLISTCGVNMQMSRKSAELLIKAGQVTVFGSEITNPNHLISVENAFGSVKVAGKLLQLDVKNEQFKNALSKDLIEDHTSTTGNEILKPHRTRVWIANKLPGELVSEHDPQGRPSLLERLSRGGVGRSRSNKSQKIHLKPIGRLDMMTEGLILVTNDGSYAHEMEHPKNKLHRTYRVRVHGFITPQKLHSLRKGMNIDGMFYKGMKVNLEIVRDNKGRNKLDKQHRAKGGNTNTWLRITCIEGKNRQIRKTLEHVGLKVTRLIRVSFGDYELNTIPSGMAIEVPFKNLESQKKKGDLLTAIRKDPRKATDVSRSPKGKNDIEAVQWIRH